MLGNPVEITENPWNYRTFRNPLKSNVLLELSIHWNFLEFTGTNILRISQNGQKSTSGIKFGVTLDRNCSRHPLSMVWIDFDTDLIDIPKILNRKSGNFPGNWEFSRDIGKFLGNFREFSLRVHLELFGIIGIYGQKLEFKITGTTLELKFPT